MSKTLLVTYTPRQGSNTKQLVDEFVAASTNKTEIEVLNLANTPPDMLLTENLNAYIQRNFMRQSLSPVQSRFLRFNDYLMNQVRDADYVVLAYPVHNFSVPAPVKAWFDAIIQMGETTVSNENGIYGVLNGKRALVLTTSGGILPHDSKDFALPLSESIFEFLGFDSVDSIGAYQINLSPEIAAQQLTKAKSEVHSFVEGWYQPAGQPAQTA